MALTVTTLRTYRITIEDETPEGVPQNKEVTIQTCKINGELYLKIGQSYILYSPSRPSLTSPSNARTEPAIVRPTALYPDQLTASPKNGNK